MNTKRSINSPVWICLALIISMLAVQAHADTKPATQKRTAKPVKRAVVQTPRSSPPTISGQPTPAKKVVAPVPESAEQIIEETLESSLPDDMGTSTDETVSIMTTESVVSETEDSSVQLKNVSTKIDPPNDSLHDALSAASELVIKPNKDSNEYHQLRYTFEKGERVVTDVTHLATTNTKINEVEQTSHSRTVSEKVWEFRDVDSEGNMTFDHLVTAVDMSQQIDGSEEKRYDSAVDTDPPAEFRSVADTIGKTISTITISPSGKVVSRSDPPKGSNLGMGDIVVPFPSDPISTGTQWEIPREIRIRRPDGSPKVVKVRERYTLEKVSAGVATLDVRTEPITPLTEPELESQALQQMNNGTIKFDIDAGRLISKSLSWDKSVVGFSGPGSVMDYSARFDELAR